MTIYTPVVEHALIPNPRMMMICRMLQDMDEEVLKECHSPNIMLFNCRIMMVCSLLSSMQGDYVKNTVSTLGFVLNRLQWVRTNQPMLWAECYNGLQDAIGTGVEEDAQ